MKKAALLIIAGTAAFAWAAEQEFKISTTATLKDGSVLKAEFLNEAVNGSTIFAQNLELRPELIQNLTFKGTNGEARATLSNADTFAITISDKAYSIKTALGDLDVPVCNLRALTFKKGPHFAGAENGLVFYCTFDDEESVATPAVGPKGTVCSREFVDGKINRALRVPTGSSAGFFPLPPGTFGKEGCIEFWAKIEPRREFYRNCDPRMIFIKSPAGWFTVEYSANNGGGRGGFCIRCFNFEYIKGGSFGESYRYSDIIPDISAWHHYAFSWTEETLTIYIDGKQLNGAYKTGEGRINDEKLKSVSACMGLPNDNTNAHNSEPNTPFTIDDLKIWDHAKSEFSLD